MKKVLLKITLLIIIYIVFIINSSVFGQSFDFELIADRNEIKPGEKVVLQLNIKNIGLENGVASFQAKLHYDVNSFDYEIVTDENSEWIKDEQYSNLNEYDLDLLFQTKDKIGTKNNQTIAKIILTAKTGIKIEKKNITLTDIVFSTGDAIPQSMNIEDKKVELTVLSDENNNNENNNSTQEEDKEKVDNTQKNEIQMTNENNTNMHQENNEQVTDNKENNKLSGDATQSTASMLPHTGIIKIFEIIALICMIGFSIFLYKKYNKWKNI